jgi:hypothetical protein
MHRNISMHLLRAVALQQKIIHAWAALLRSRSGWFRLGGCGGSVNYDLFCELSCTNNYDDFAPPSLLYYRPSHCFSNLNMKVEDNLKSTEMFAC